MLLLLSLTLVAGLVTLHQALQIARQYLDTYRGSLKNVFKSVKGSVLLIIAHPDDECMFFAPTIRMFFRMGVQVHVLCLSTGNHDGLGVVRERELVRSCRVLGVASCVALDELQDGPENVWDADKVESALEKYFETCTEEITTLMTFDRFGVSGHPNHCDAGRGVVQFASNTTRGDFAILQLETVPMLSKYIGLLGIIYEFVLCRLLSSLEDHQEKSNDAIRTVALMPAGEYYGIGVGAMRQHASQTVWFRYLYLLLSRYMHVNTLVLRRPIRG